MPKIPEWGSYVVCISGHKKLRRLHRVGNCFRIPGVHYLVFKDYGSQCPPSRSYDVICLDCWRATAKDGDSGDDVSEEVSSSSGSEEGQGG